MISRIVIIDKDNPFLPELQEVVNSEQIPVEIKNSNLFGLDIEHAYLITSRSRQAA